MKMIVRNIFFSLYNNIILLLIYKVYIIICFGRLEQTVLMFFFQLEYKLYYVDTWTKYKMQQEEREQKIKWQREEQRKKDDEFTK